MVSREYVVEFAGCEEAVVRVGTSPDAVAFPDDGGCKPTRIRPLAEVRLRSMPWMKGGELRVSVAEEHEYGS